MSRLLFVSTLMASYLHIATGQFSCTTPNGTNGKCISIYNCDSLLKFVQQHTAEELDFLKKSFCRFIENSPWVCCPSEACITPDGAEGTCVELHSCSHLAKILQSNPSQEDKQYVEKYRCGSREQHNVCCGPQPKYKANSLQIGGRVRSCQLTAFPPEPSTECCGVDAGGGDNRIVGGNATAVDEYPWLAIIEYVKGNQLKLMCGGVLISGRYVLTAGHCLVGPVVNMGTPVNVRLGEYDTFNFGPDCVEVEGGGEDCTDGALVVPIEKTITHPGYNPDSALRRHDIALIRLDRTVQYTDFIRPICLPTADFTTARPGQTTLYAAGWGAVSDVQGSSNIKLKVDLPYLSYQDCQPSYNVSIRRVPLWDGQMCAGGVNGKDSCRGDSGGPLMRQNDRFFELVGIVSFGPTPCGMENVPGVYSKVFYYLPWIRSNIIT